MTPALTPDLAARRAVPWLVGIILAGVLAVVAVRVSPLMLLALPAMAVAALALLRWPWLGTALLIASVPVQQFGAVGGGAVTLTRASIGVAVAGLVLWWTVARQPVVLTRFAIPFLLLIFWMFVTAHVARDVPASSSELLRWAIAYFAFLAAVQVLVGASERVVTAFIVAIAVVAVIEAALGAALGLLGFGPESFQIQNSVSRAYGTFGRPNTFAGYLEMAVFPVLWFGLYRVQRLNAALRDYVSARRAGFRASAASRRDLAGAAVLVAGLLGAASVIMAGILVSFSRGAWLGVATGLAVTVAIAARRYWQVVLPAAPIGLLVAIAFLVLAAPATLTDRLSSITDEARPFDASSITITDDNFAVAERMAHWQAGWRMFEDHPLAGVGVGNFNANYPDYFVREEFRHSQGHAHNYYIHTLAETGIVGLAIYLVLILSIAFVALRVAIDSTDRLAGAMALGALGTMTAVYIHNAFENLHVLNLGVQLSATWALALAAHYRWVRSRAARSIGGVEYSRE